MSELKLGQQVIRREAGQELRGRIESISYLVHVEDGRLLGSAAIQLTPVDSTDGRPAPQPEPW
jgi:acyl-CoA thioesterase FadM